MKTHNMFRFLLVMGVAGSVVHAQEVRLDLEVSGTSLHVAHATTAGKTYTVQASSDLVTWADAGPANAGDGQVAHQAVGSVDGVCRFYRLVVTDAPVELAPTPVRMAELLVGKKQFGYSFTSAARFAWNAEAGNWNYTKTGADAGLLVLTYDEDSNNGSLYREEIALKFTTTSGGTYQYSEYTHDALTYTSSGMFTLN